MAADASAWSVLDHGPIVRLTERLWWVQGALPGMSLKRVMSVARLQSGGLAIHGAIALREPERAQLEAWGKPELLIVPSGIHRLDAPRYKQRYPELRVLAPSGSRDKVAEVVPVDGTYQDFIPDGVLELRNLPGVGEREGLMLVRSDDGLSLVFNDVVMNMDSKRDLLGYLFTTLLGSAPGPRVSRLSKLLLVKDRAALRAELLRLAALPDLARLIVAHEKVTTGRAEARAALERAASYL